MLYFLHSIKYWLSCIIYYPWTVYHIITCHAWLALKSHRISWHGDEVELKNSKRLTLSAYIVTRMISLPLLIMRMQSCV